MDPTTREILLCWRVVKHAFMTFSSELSCAWRWALLASNGAPAPTSAHDIVIHPFFSPLGHSLNVSLARPDSAEILIYVLIVSCPDCSSSSFIVFLYPCSLNFRGVSECYGERADACFWKVPALCWSNVYWPVFCLTILFPYWLVMGVWLENGWN